MMPRWAWLVCAFCLFAFQFIIADAIKADPSSRILKVVRALMIVAILLALIEGIAKYEVR
jgi:VIT1/CCC1 family predicted Fe2+/Mn2+ transporter